MVGAGWSTDTGGLTSNFHVIEKYAHELAHSIVIGRGRAIIYFESRLDQMSMSHRNKNELITMATQIAALKRLGFHISIKNTAAPAVQASLEREYGYKSMFRTRASIIRWLHSYKPSERNVTAFVRMVRSAAKALPQ